MNQPSPNRSIIVSHDEIITNDHTDRIAPALKPAIASKLFSIRGNGAVQNDHSLLHKQAFNMNNASGIKCRK